MRLLPQSSRPEVLAVSARPRPFAAAVVALTAVLSSPRPASAQATPYDSTVFAALKWREIGIFRGGRSVAVAGSASRPNEYWMGTTGGGVFKTTDGGNTWLPAADKYFGGTIGAFGVSESNPDVVYVGTGEYPIRGNVSHRDGDWTTSDAGKTGTLVGLARTQEPSSLRLHPTYHPGPPVGLLGNIGLAVSPAKPGRRWALIEADSGGVYRSDDGGGTWRYVNGERKLRQRPWYYSRIFADPKDSNTVYALNVLAYKSTDGGATFRHLPDPHGDNHDM